MVYGVLEAIPLRWPRASHLDVYYVSVASFMRLGIASLPLAWQHLRKEDVRKVYKCEKGVFSVCLLT